MRTFCIYLALISCTALALPQNLNNDDQYDAERRGIQQYLKFDLQDAKGFRSALTPHRQAKSDDEEDDEELDNASSSAQVLSRRPNGFDNDNYPNAIPQQIRQQPQPQQQYRRPSQPPQQFRKPGLDLEKELEEEEIEEPDRLSLLLPNSKFDCGGKNTGYYADEGLQCEVFHYCQEGTKHSWICPEGFTFHQVHLICMPPSGDNICQKSSEYHFVNEYLYKPLNQEEAESRPNVTIRYSDRYYPEHYNLGPEQNDDEEEQYRQPPRRQPQPVQVQYKRPAPTQPPQQQYQPTQRPASQYQFRPTGQQVFHSPEEVNISLQQRRPLIVAGAAQKPFQYHPSQPSGFDFNN